MVTSFYNSEIKKEGKKESKKEDIEVLKRWLKLSARVKSIKAASEEKAELFIK